MTIIRQGVRNLKHPNNLFGDQFQFRKHILPPWQNSVLKVLSLLWFGYVLPTEYWI